MAAVIAIGTCAALLFTTIVDGVYYDDSSEQVVPMVLGMLGLATIVPVVASVVLGHVALSATRHGRTRGRATAGIAVGVGYVLLALYVVRIVNAASVASQGYSGEVGELFLQNIFYWA